MTVVDDLRRSPMQPPVSTDDLAYCDFALAFHAFEDSDGTTLSLSCDPLHNESPAL